MAAAGGPLEQLVRDELRGPVTEIVQRVIRDLVAEALNGQGKSTLHAGTTPMTAAGEAVRECRVCGQTGVRFEKGRKVCVPCRRRAERERKARRQEPADEEPHPAMGSGSDPAPRGKRWGAGARQTHWDEKARELIEQARQNGVSLEQRDGVVFRVLHLPRQVGSPAEAQ